MSKRIVANATPASFSASARKQIMDAGHFLSAGMVSFARGLNDTPKIVALLLLWKALDIRWGFFAVALVMAIGGLLNARKIAETMSNKITAMNHGQGFSANLTTAMLVVARELLRFAGFDHARLGRFAFRYRPNDWSGESARGGERSSSPGLSRCPAPRSSRARLFYSGIKNFSTHEPLRRSSCADHSCRCVTPKRKSCRSTSASSAI